MSLLASIVLGRVAELIRSEAGNHSNRTLTQRVAYFP